MGEASPQIIFVLGCGLTLSQLAEEAEEEVTLKQVHGYAVHLGGDS